MNSLALSTALYPAQTAPKLWLAIAVTLIFAAFGRAVRGVTNSGAVAGAVVCFALLVGSGWAGFAGLSTVFVVTWAATRWGYARKQSMGTAEPRTGRTAAQVFANIGVAAICAAAAQLARRAHPSLSGALELGSCAALCEAAADTVSSEIGQAIGLSPRFITNWRRVTPGSNGAITLPGTVAGFAAAAIVAFVYGFFGTFGWRMGVLCASAGIMGMCADSLLGATLERPGWLGNNVVNFLSTLIAALIALELA